MKEKNQGSILHQEILIIKSSLTQLKKVENFCMKIAKEARFTEDESYTVAIVLTELVNNAIIHGNKQDPEKNVTIHADIFGDRVRISVRDEGEGFYVEKLDNPTKPENIWKDSGRGIFIARNLVNNIEFANTSSGMEVIFTQYKKNE